MKKTHIATLLTGFLAIHVDASEMTASLASKVAESDLVAIIRITAVKEGEITIPPDWPSAAQAISIDAAVVDRIKGKSPENIVISAYSTSYTMKDEFGNPKGTRMCTAGFSAYGIHPGLSYIAYLRKKEEGQYTLTWNSNQYLEVISDDGSTVNDVGQTRDQVPLRPKLWLLKALAAVGAPPVILTALLATLVFASIWITRKKRLKAVVTAM